MCPVREIMIHSAKGIGRIVKNRRKELGLTQTELALTAGTGLRYIVDLEKGKPTIELEKALKVINALGIEITLENK